MKEGNAINTLISKLENYQVVSIVGNIKNAGKTTVLNHLIKAYKNQQIAITSIGLDGEKIDQVNHLPKPRIFIYENMMVATAKKCLDECEITYEIIEKTKIETSLGLIYIIKATSSGYCLVGGASSLFSMKEIILKLKRYHPFKILIDGAFSRTTLTELADATILSVGASYSNSLTKTVTHAYHLTKLFSLEKYKGIHDLENINYITLINSDDKLITLDNDSTLDLGEKIVSSITNDTKAIYIPKAVSPSFIKAFIKHRNELRADLITYTPTNLLADDVLLSHLFKLKQKIYVVKPTKLVALTYNPFSPKGNVNTLEFKNVLEEKINLPIYNVLEKSNNNE